MDYSLPLMKLANHLRKIQIALDNLWKNVEYTEGEPPEWRTREHGSIKSAVAAIEEAAGNGIDAALSDALDRKPRAWTVELILLVRQAASSAYLLANPKYDRTTTSDDLDRVRKTVAAIERKHREASAVTAVMAIDKTPDPKAPPVTAIAIKPLRNSKWVRGLAFADRYLEKHPHATDNEICVALKRYHVKGFTKRPTVKHYHEARAYRNCQSNGKNLKPPAEQKTEKRRNNTKRKDSAKKIRA